MLEKHKAATTTKKSTLVPPPQLMSPSPSPGSKPSPGLVEKVVAAEVKKTPKKTANKKALRTEEDEQEIRSPSKTPIANEDSLTAEQKRQQQMRKYTLVSFALLVCKPKLDD